MFHLANPRIVAIYELVIFRRQRIQKSFYRGSQLFHFAQPRIRGGDVFTQRLNMDIHVRGRVPQHAYAFFQFRGLPMRFAQA